MTDHIIKLHNKTVILYHLVCPTKYRKKVFTEEVEKTLKEVCFKIVQCYEIYFVEIGADQDHVHFLIQSVLVLSPSEIVQTTKSITAKQIFRRHTEIKELLWGGHFWTSVFYLNTVGLYGNETVLRRYVEEQGLEYKQIYRGQLKLLD